MAPRVPASTIRRATACPTRKYPFRLTLRMASHSASLISRRGVRFRIPALFTRMSRPPRNSSASATRRSTSAREAVEPGTATARRPRASISATAPWASRRLLRYPTATSAPSRASPRAMARPMLREPPVTRARLPARRIGIRAIVPSESRYRARARLRTARRPREHWPSPAAGKVGLRRRLECGARFGWWVPARWPSSPW